MLCAGCGMVIEQKVSDSFSTVGTGLSDNISILKDISSNKVPTLVILTKRLVPAIAVGFLTVLQCRNPILGAGITQMVRRDDSVSSSSQDQNFSQKISFSQCLIDHFEFYIYLKKLFTLEDNTTAWELLINLFC